MKAAFNSIKLPDWLKEAEMVRIRCFWYLENRKRDIVNFHDELCDAIQESIDINDRYFKLTDENVFYGVPFGDTKVTVIIEPCVPVENSRQFGRLCKETDSSNSIRQKESK